VQERYLPENLPFHYSPIAIRYSPLAAVLMRRKFSAAQERCPPENSLLATRCSPFASRQSPIAAVSRLADLPISRFADKFGSAGASPFHFVHRLKSVATKNEAC
jgi:hypothetical protein